MTRLPGSLPLLDWGALLVLSLATWGFLELEAVPFMRIVLYILLGAAVLLALTRRDRVLFAVLAIYLSGATLLSFLLNQVVPVYMIFSATWLLSSLFFYWLLNASSATQSGRVHWLLSLGGGLFLVELLWFLVPWPVDPKSKAAILSIFFYGIWVLIRKEQERQPETKRAWALMAVWLFILLAVVVWFAEWS